MLKTLIIIPTYNEADNITSLIPAIFALDLRVDILIVDDNSPDGTAEQVIKLQTTYPELYLLKRQQKDGLGRAYLDGFAFAQNHKYDAVIQMDADWSHSPQHLPALLGALATNDFVIGSRYVTGGGVVNWPLSRQLISRGGGLYARLILGSTIKDLTGGFNGWRLTTLNKLNLATISSNGYSFQIELKVKANQTNSSYQEVPIIFEERRLGQSKLRGKIVAEAIWRVWQIKWQLLNKKILAALLALLILTVIVYQPVFKSSFLKAWDDNLQVINNPDITALTWENFKIIFSSFYIGMYQPLTTISYALDYHFFGLNSAIFHGTNLLLHLLNIILVYCLAKNIFKKAWLVLSKAEAPALAVATIFALHPLQVEAVAWVSARSTLLCSMFLLLGTLSYWRHLSKKQNNDLWKTLAFFLLALFSKALAIIFPLVMILLDWYHHQLNKKILLKKIPFFLISLIFGLIMLKARQEAGHLGNFGNYYTWWENILLVLTSLSFYLTKLLWPLNLSAFYAYPLKNNNLLPLTFYLSPLLVLILSGGLVYLKKIHRLPRLVILSLCWFIINLILVLKIVVLGAQTVTDRYNYLAMLGWLVIIVFYLNKVTNKKPKLRWFFISLFLLIIIGLSFLSRARAVIWQNDLSLLNDAVTKSYPGTNLYGSLGMARWEAQDYLGALEAFNHSLVINSGNFTVHYYRGLLLAENFQRYPEALQELDLVIKNEPNDSLYYTRGNIKNSLSDFLGASEDYTQAIYLNDNWLYYFSRANAYGQLKKYELALTDYNQTIKLAPDFTSAYYYQGVTLLNLKRQAAACQAWQQGVSRGLKLNPTQAKLCPEH